MITISKKYIRRKEMDSVLSSMVEDTVDYNLELSKSLKKTLKRENLYLFRDIESSVRTLFSSLAACDKKEVIISGLAPSYLYNILIESGYTPIVVDVDVDSGVFNSEKLTKNIGLNTAFVINSSQFGVMYPTNLIQENGVSVIELIDSGFGLNIDGDIFGCTAEYSIISMEENNVISSMGGALLTFNKSDINSSIEQIIEEKKYIKLSSMNSSFALSLLSDLTLLFEKKKQLVQAFKDSVLKSGYHTLENQEFNIYNFFPVVLKRGLKDAQKYSKKNGVEINKSFSGTVVQCIDGVKAKNAKSLCSRTVSFPVYLGMNKDSLSLILKILSTLP